MLNVFTGFIIASFFIGLLHLWTMSNIYTKGYNTGKSDANIAILESKELKDLEALRCSYVIDEGKIPEALK